MKEEMLAALLKYFKARSYVSGHAFNNDSTTPYTLKEVVAEFRTYEAAVRAVKILANTQKPSNTSARRAATNTVVTEAAAAAEDLAAEIARKLEELASED